MILVAKQQYINVNKMFFNQYIIKIEHLFDYFIIILIFFFILKKYFLAIWVISNPSTCIKVFPC